MDEMERGMIVSVESTGDDRGQPQAESEEGQLLTRFLLGLLLLGSDELLARLRALQAEVEAGAELAAGEVVSEDETMGALLGYMALGAFLQGQRRMVQGIRRGLRFSVTTTGRALGMLNRLTDNPIGRPFRRPVERWIWNLMQEGELAIREGRRGAQEARLLAARTVGNITNDTLEAIAGNPELTELIRRQVGQQSAGLAGTIVDNTRQITTSADNVAEGVVRRLLRRKPRRELPPSPLAGQPLTMYATQRPAQGVEDDDQ